MKSIYLFSKRESVIRHWEESVLDEYKSSSFAKIDSLYASLENNNPAVILFDYDGEIEFVEELLHYVHGRSEQTLVMAFNSKPIFANGVRLIKEGAKAFMNTYASPNNIKQAIKAVIGGNIWLYPEFIQMMIKQSVLVQTSQHEVLDKLSVREREIAEMVALGMSNKEIAKTAEITEQTVKTHLKTVYEKLEVSSRLALAVLLNNHTNSYESSIDSNA